MKNSFDNHMQAFQSRCFSNSGSSHSLNVCEYNEWMSVRNTHLSSSVWFIHILSIVLFIYTHHHHHNHNRFTALFPGPPGWAGARRKLLDFVMQGRLTEADTRRRTLVDGSLESPCWLLINCNWTSFSVSYRWGATRQNVSRLAAIRRG